MNELKVFIADNLSGFSPKAIPNFLFSFIICSLLSFLLGRMYIKYGHTISNRKAFAKNFLILAITTMFIISVVKSSLALSLGLVGALSIVRFRSAIKEPEELTYLFLTIAIGLGCGAGLALLTIVAFVCFCAVIWFNARLKKEVEGQSLYLTISGQSQVDLQSVVDLLKIHTNGLKLKRSDEQPAGMEASFFVEFDGFEQLETCKKALKELYPQLSIVFMDNTREF